MPFSIAMHAATHDRQPQDTETVRILSAETPMWGALRKRHDRSGPYILFILALRDSLVFALPMKGTRVRLWSRAPNFDSCTLNAPQEMLRRKYFQCDIFF